MEGGIRDGLSLGGAMGDRCENSWGVNLQVVPHLGTRPQHSTGLPPGGHATHVSTRVIQHPNAYATLTEQNRIYAAQTCCIRGSRALLSMNSTNRL
jgi:hypothetical protein